MAPATTAHDHGSYGLFHSHSHGDFHCGGQNASERRLWWSLSVLAVFTAFEAIGGFWSHSIALLAEAAHMLADCGSLVLAVLAIRVSRRPARPDRTYGHRRYQPLAAYTNGLLLLAITVGVIVEASKRLMSVPEVNGGVMMGVAFAGGVANFVAFLILSGGGSLNERGARAHVLSDLLGSVAAIVGAGIILYFHWYPADPLLSLAVSLLILRSGWGLDARLGACTVGRHAARIRHSSRGARAHWVVECEKRSSHPRLVPDRRGADSDPACGLR